MEKKFKIGLVVGVCAIVGVLGGSIAYIGFLAPINLRLNFSSTNEPVIMQAMVDFKAKNPRYAFAYVVETSTDAIVAAGDGSYNIGFCSRDVKSEELILYPDLVSENYAKDAIAFIIDFDHTHGVTNLGFWDIRGMYNGTYTNWNQVGSGSSVPIVLVGRQADAALRSLVEKMFGLDNDTDYDNNLGNILEYNSQTEAQEKVASEPGAIGYVGLGFIDNTTVLGVSVDGVAPTVSNTRTGTYSYSRNLNMVTKGTPSADERKFMDFLLSPEGQQIVTDKGLVSIA